MLHFKHYKYVSLFSSLKCDNVVIVREWHWWRRYELSLCKTCLLMYIELYRWCELYKTSYTRIYINTRTHVFCHSFHILTQVFLVDKTCFHCFVTGLVLKTLTESNERKWQHWDSKRLIANFIVQSETKTIG